MTIFVYLYQNFLMVVLAILCCFVSAQAMEDLETNRERLKEATLVFIEKYVNSRNDQSRGRMLVDSCLLQYVPERLTREFSPHARCSINMATIDEIATVIGIDDAIEGFAANYRVFKENELLIKRMKVSNYLCACVSEEERETIELHGQSRIGEEKADQIARFLKIIT